MYLSNEDRALLRRAAREVAVRYERTARPTDVRTAYGDGFADALAVFVALQHPSASLHRLPSEFHEVIKNMETC